LMYEESLISRCVNGPMNRITNTTGSLSWSVLNFNQLKSSHTMNYKTNFK